MSTMPLYLDYAATTPVDPRVAEVMARHLTLEGTFANPASRSHMSGWLAEQAVETGRRQVSDLIGADPREIVWTSGATEADNLALIGYMRAHRDRGRHLITSAIEHKAVLDSAAALEQEGFEVTRLMPHADGTVSPEDLKAALRPDTVLVSLMAVNNELGSINDLQALGSIAAEHGAAFHVDAAQAAGRIELDMSALPIDMLSLSAHKAYGPKGIGALFVRRGIRIEALIHGGGHERGMRSGTLPTHQIAGMGKAFALAQDEQASDNAHLEQLGQQFRQGLRRLEGTWINAGGGEHVTNIINVGFEGVDGEALIMALRGLAVSTGSACNSASVDPSYVLTGIGLTREQALASIRFSFGRFSRVEEIDQALESLSNALGSLRTRQSA
ncbi:aminotransferase class V-fold PLP-dependent enzyme [Kushneria indalinina]|uniref:cysteine desulfurase n=1 Tax=Kushneria indalinina DSM 14324 TaxID=1122140 RepID=A0A3D9DRZ8_9GAMM|nr:aminotransferase class V-fold PLP-dependent enzyme [Kushneria indalinina]REC93507.1 cysteine desulfurase IscS [Kushneria indalinina DSM 14324]